MSAETKLLAMVRGVAVTLSNEQLDALDGEGWIIRTAHSAECTGVLDRWIGWMSGPQSTLPPGLRIDPKTLKATARAGRCRFASGGPLPEGYTVPDEYAHR